MNEPQSPILYIAIDPDVEQCGVAEIDSNSTVMRLTTKDPIELMEWLITSNGLGLIKVFIEASHKTTTNWHTGLKDRPSVAAKKGYSVGRCHEVGILLVTLCKKYGIPFEEVLPLGKIWGSKNSGKISHEQLLLTISARGISLDNEHQNRSNQEERDAALIALTRSKLIKQ